MEIPAKYSRPTPYEQSALQEIATWKAPKSGLLHRAYQRVNATMDDATNLVRKVPGVDWTLDTFVAGLLDLINEIAQDWVWTDQVYRDFQRRGHSVQAPGDALLLDMEHVDDIARGLNPKYTSVATAEGAATGAVGAAGILPDLLSIVAINLRAAGEFAAHYGFDPRTEEERLYTLSILGAVASGEDLNKELALKPVRRVSAGLAHRQVIESAGQFAVTKSLKATIEKLGIHLTRAKLLQILPAIGAVVGGSFNMIYTTQVCTTSYHLYRERFLITKYGADVIREGRDSSSS